MNYNHLNINERSCIYQFLSLGMSIRGIAKALHRSPSTISREIKRNSYRTWSNFKEHDRYFPVKAQEKYEKKGPDAIAQPDIRNRRSIISKRRSKTTGLRNSW